LLCANMCVYNFLEIEAKNKKNLGAPLWNKELSRM
jgi:hypothetical protein